MVELEFEGEERCWEEFLVESELERDRESHGTDRLMVAA